MGVGGVEGEGFGNFGASEVEASSAAVEESEVAVQARGGGALFLTLPAGVDGFAHFGDGLGPILSGGGGETEGFGFCFGSGGAEVIDEIVEVLALGVGVGIVFGKGLNKVGQRGEGRVVGIVHGSGEFEVFEGFVGAAKFFELESEEILRVDFGGVGGEDLLEILCGEIGIVGLGFGEAEEVERVDEIGVEFDGGGELFAGSIVIGGFVEKAAESKVRGGGLGIEAFGAREIFEGGVTVAVIGESAAEFEMGGR